MKPRAAQFFAPVVLSGDAEIPQRFQGVAYSGGLAVPSYWGPAVIDLASTTVSAPCPLLFRHDQDMLSVGVVRTIENTGTEIRDSGELHIDLADEGGITAKGIAIRSKRGEPYQQSLGLYDFSEEEVPPQKVVEVNGRTFTGPLTVMRGGVVREVTIAPLGADPNTHAAVFAATTQMEGRMPEVDPKVAELTAEINGLRPKVAELTRRAEGAEAEVTRLKAELAVSQAAVTAVRTEQTKALFAECGLDPKDEARVAAFVALPGEAYTAMAEALRAANKPAGAVNPALFQNVATGDPNAEQPGPAKFTPRPLKSTRDLYAHMPNKGAA